jgi:hypothetical protein
MKLTLTKAHRIDRTFTASLSEKSLIQQVNRSLYDYNDFWRYGAGYVLEEDLTTFIMAADLLGIDVSVNYRLVTGI